MPAINVSVKPKVYTNLEEAVSYTGFDKSKIVEQALEKYLAELKEDAEDARIAEEAWRRFEASGEKAIPAEEVYRELGI